ncbi:MAG: hypothetical protein JSW27_05480 [Phycisphaerales bacterium]|nr:MAG: hypothetical protein JSW27_05480 [Phycisphaerales bacterium]
MSMRRKIVTVIVFAAGHFVAMLLSMAVSFEITHRAFDGEEYPPYVGYVADTVHVILSHPGRFLLHARLSKEMEWLVVTGNSVLWGLAATLIIHYWGRFMKRGGRGKNGDSGAVEKVPL